MDGTVLVADDDRTIRTVLTQAFTRAGCKVHATASLITLMRWVDEGRGDLVICDVIMPDGNGLETLPKIAKNRPDLPVIVISAQNTIMTAIHAAEAEAYDYLPKPFDLPDLMKRAARAMIKSTAPAAPIEADLHDTALPLVGKTPSMQELYRLVARILNVDLSVLIAGESGTGKSLIARVIHAHGERRHLPFIVVDASDLERDGACQKILDRAAGGTVLFDEIGDISKAAQSHLARSLDSQAAATLRFLATTQTDITALVDAGDFRADLLYRLNAVTLNVPPLRSRLEDIPLLVAHFVDQSETGPGAKKSISDEAIARMCGYLWHGNVRELENTVRRLLVTCPENRIGGDEVTSALGPVVAPVSDASITGNEVLSQSIFRHLTRYFDMHKDTLPPAGLYARILKEMEVPLIEIALQSTNGNQAKCAELLGINRNTLRKKVTDLDIRVTRRQKMM